MSSPTQIVRGAVSQTGNGPFPMLLVESDGRLRTSIGGSAADGSTGAVNPVEGGARYNSTPPTYTTGQLAENQADGAGNQKVVVASRPGTDRSLTTTANASGTILMAANANRNGFFIENDGTTDVWINFIGAAAATAGGGNKKILAAGGYYELKGVTNAITIFSTAAVPITALEW